MWLLIDAGNTMIKWALVLSSRSRLGKWKAHGAVTHKDIALLKEVLKDAPMIDKAIISNVAGKALRARLEKLLMGAKQPIEIEWFASTQELAGIRNGYRNPRQLGCDRFAAMIGARALYPNHALLVVNCGTATTVDAVSADGLFVGGMILPGLRTMASSLTRNTAHLPYVAENTIGLNPFAINTTDAIVSGCIAGQVGAIELAMQRHMRHYEDGVICVISGGAAFAIAPHLSFEYERVDNLVLVGLHRVTRLKK